MLALSWREENPWRPDAGGPPWPTLGAAEERLGAAVVAVNTGKQTNLIKRHASVDNSAITATPPRGSIPELPTGGWGHSED
ncbi:hypothetical protein CRUP_027945 [Coryphaenoides rupestris]|nr:hypothetical protein CRUP_027945 [Coryphaenoides rupestris]